MNLLTVFLFVLLGILFLALIAAIYFIIRNELVYRFRVRMLHSHYDIYRQLPDYDKMLYSIKLLRIENYINTNKQI
jgi:hypothetical protein